MKMYVIMRTQFEGIHWWPGCNIEEVSFLKNPHRHIFHVECKAQVNHTDRDIEFIQMKRRINGFIKSMWPTGEFGSCSCENIAESMLNYFPELCSVKIFEDNENGCQIDRE